MENLVKQKNWLNGKIGQMEKLVKRKKVKQKKMVKWKNRLNRKIG